MSLEINTELLKELESYKNSQSQISSTCSIQENKEYILTLVNKSLEQIKNQYDQNKDLFHQLEGVMHFVDKWLEGYELQHHPVNRASMMRDKTLRIIEEKDQMIELLKKENKLLNYQKNNLIQLLAASNKHTDFIPDET